MKLAGCGWAVTFCLFICRGFAATGSLFRSVLTDSGLTVTGNPAVGSSPLRSRGGEGPVGAGRDGAAAPVGRLL